MSQLSRLFDVLQLLRSRVNRELPIQQAVLLITVAQHPGITMPELMQVLDMPQGTVSRNVKTLSHSISLQNGVAVPRGYGLLRTMPSVDNRQVLAVFLTGRGEVLLGEIARQLDGGQDGAEEEIAPAQLVDAAAQHRYSH